MNIHLCANHIVHFNFSIFPGINIVYYTGINIEVYEDDFVLEELFTEKS